MLLISDHCAPCTKNYVEFSGPNTIYVEITYVNYKYILSYCEMNIFTN